jgi:predicted homoserine dehydrogenase-like protein
MGAFQKEKSMFGLLDQLRELRKPIAVGIVGIGSIGRGMLQQARITPGIRCLAIADRDVDRAVAAAERFRIDYQIVHTLREMNEVVHQERLAVCSDGDLVARCDLLDVFMEATNSVADGGRYGVTALEHNKHLVMMNHEADLMFGSWLMHLALEKGLVYTVCDGDQPAVLRRLSDELTFMGFDLVMAGNIKGFLDPYANPTTIVPEADKRNLDYSMCTSYTDGTKLSIEMAVLANGLGLRTAMPGMLGPRFTDVYQIFEHFNFDELWDGKTGLVDYVLGAKPAGGVFAVGYTDDPYRKETLSWLPSQMGPGPFYLFYRPYHLCHFETMATVAEAVLNHRPVLQPRYGFRTNVYAYAKRDLRTGETLDGIGGYTCYGKIENCGAPDEHPGLPICLANGVSLRHDIPRDGNILLKDVIHDPDDYAFSLFRKSVAIAPNYPRS